MGDDCFPEFLHESEFDDLFSILETLDTTPVENSTVPPLTVAPLEDQTIPNSKKRLVSQKSVTSSLQRQESNEIEFEASPTTSKKRKISVKIASSTEEEVLADGQEKVSHIKVERNRRKQMNEHLSVLRSLMPCFYVKRGDQASIIGGVVDYIKEMQQVLQSLEAKKQRKVYSEVLSPRLVSSPKHLPLSPRKPPLSPRLSLPISPRTPNPRLSLPISPRTPNQTSPYKPRMQPLQQQCYLSPSKSSTTINSHDQPCSSSSLDNFNVKELVTNSKSLVAEVEVKFSGPNLLLKTLSARIPGQPTKIIAALEGLSLEILHVSINTIDPTTMLNSFTIKK